MKFSILLFLTASQAVFANSNCVEHIISPVECTAGWMDDSGSIHTCGAGGVGATCKCQADGSAKCYSVLGGKRPIPPTQGYDNQD